MPADIGIGIVIGLLGEKLLGIPLFYSVLAGIVFSILPDIDYFFLPLFKGRVTNHREIIHLPIPYLILGGMAVYFVLGSSYTVIFVFASFYHFIHDTIALGWGIKWFYPFSDYSYLFFYLWDYETKEKSFFKKLNKEGLRRTEKLYGNPNWIKTYYFSPNPISIIEYSILFISFLLIGMRLLQNYNF